MTPLAEDYDDLIVALRAPIGSKSKETIDAIAGIRDRYSSKILGVFLRALSVRLVVAVNPEAMQQNSSRYVKSDKPHFREETAPHGAVSGRRRLR